MIKTNELRVGNWINYSETDTYFKVTEITKTMLEVENSEESTWIETDQFGGVPLTREILEKCNLDGYRVEVITYPAEVNDDVVKPEKKYVVFDGRELRVRMDYLHQLQNLYHALAGKELEINL